MLLFSPHPVGPYALHRVKPTLHRVVGPYVGPYATTKRRRGIAVPTRRQAARRPTGGIWC